MKDSMGQKKAHNFLLQKFSTHEQFSKDEFRTATEWSKKTFNTYWPKQFKTLLLVAGRDKYRVSEVFRRFISWESFKEFVSQTRKIASDYTTLTYENVIMFDFFMPLTNEGYLRSSLDALFYEDSILTKLKSVDKRILFKHFPQREHESDDDYLDRLCIWISDRFGGYSINHVDGRFRADNLKSIQDAYAIMKMGGRYLIDETTAIVRFIFPIGEPKPNKYLRSANYLEDLAIGTDGGDTEKEANAVRVLFYILFVESIIQVVNGEDEIWLLESGMKSRLHIWRVNKNHG